MKLNPKMFIKNFLNTNTCLNSATINPTNKKVIGKMKDYHKGIPINEFVGLKSKLHSIFSENKKESNATKGVNIAIELNE